MNGKSQHTYLRTLEEDQFPKFSSKESSRKSRTAGAVPKFWNLTWQDF